MQRHVLNRLEDPRLQTYVVWGPMLDKETEDDARSATSHVGDARSTHFWTPDHAIAEAFQGPLGLELERAWDTFLLYEPGVRWDDTPPTPTYFMHVGKRLPEEQKFNGDKLREAAQRMLDASTAAAVD
ncbi:MAG: hypothetical protein AAF657_06110 [Acidobacteriota bacterium]